MNFMKWIPLYVAISLAVIIPGVYSMLHWGFSLSIGFTGGTLLEIQTVNKDATLEAVQAVAESVFTVDSVQPTGENTFLIRGEEINDAEFTAVSEALKSKIGEFTLLRFEAIGPVISAELIRKTIAAVAFVAAIIMGYIGWQFNELKYGVSAVVAMLHDSLVLLGVFSLLGHFYGLEVDVLFVTAMLTTLSFSVHDTIVVFHRIKELRQAYPRSVLRDILNAALTETMTRSLNNSLTIILMLGALVLLGGKPLFGFSLALLIGAITGTYSSPFVAVPFLLGWEKTSLWLMNQKKRRAR